METIKTFIKGITILNPEKVEKKILKKWDQNYKKGTFPYFGTDENSASSTARISAFRSDSEWLVIVKFLLMLQKLERLSIQFILPEIE